MKLQEPLQQVKCEILKNSQVQINAWTRKTVWLLISDIAPMQKWLPLNYSLVCIQNSLNNLIRDNKFFTISVSKTRLVRLFWIWTKEWYKGSIFAWGLWTWKNLLWGSSTRSFLKPFFLIQENIFWKFLHKFFCHHFTWNHWLRKFPIVLHPIIIQNYDV